LALERAGPTPVPAKRQGGPGGQPAARRGVGERRCGTEAADFDGRRNSAARTASERFDVPKQRPWGPGKPRAGSARARRTGFRRGAGRPRRL